MSPKDAQAVDLVLIRLSQVSQHEWILKKKGTLVPEHRSALLTTFSSFWPDQIQFGLKCWHPTRKSVVLLHLFLQPRYLYLPRACLDYFTSGVTTTPKRSDESEMFQENRGAVKYSAAKFYVLQLVRHTVLHLWPNNIYLKHQLASHG